MDQEIYQTPFAKRSGAKELRIRARIALKNRWGIAILVLLLATLLGAFTSVGEIDRTEEIGSEKIEEIETVIRESTAESEYLWDAVVDAATAFGNRLAQWGKDQFDTHLLSWIVTGMSGVCAILFYLFVGAPVWVGYHRFNLDLIDGNAKGCGTLFRYFSVGYWKAVGVRVLVDLIRFAVNLGAILLAFAGFAVAYVAMVTWIISGTVFLTCCAVCAVILFAGAAWNVIISYRYALCGFILAEYPELGAVDAMRNSHTIMRGNKWRLFCLEFSFIGWFFLCLLTFGIGFLWLAPYRNAAKADFYDEISNRATARQVTFPSLDPDDYVS